MIDIYNTIYDTIRTKLLEINVSTSSSYQLKQTNFPHVTIEELSNIIDLNTVDTDGVFRDNISFEINIYSKSKTPRKEINPIIKVIDEYMVEELRTNRNFSNQTPNYLDDIYRYTLRYNFFVDENNRIYRR